MVHFSEWFVQGQNAKLSRFSMLLNFPSYMKNNISERIYYFTIRRTQGKSILLTKRELSFSVDVILYLLHLRYTPLQAYHLLLNKYPLPPVSFLKKIQEGDADAMKAPKVLKMKHESSGA